MAASVALAKLRKELAARDVKNIDPETRKILKESDAGTASDVIECLCDLVNLLAAKNSPTGGSTPGTPGSDALAVHLVRNVLWDMRMCCSTEAAVQLVLDAVAAAGWLLCHCFVNDGLYGVGGPGTVMASGKPCWIEDASSAENFHRQAVAADIQLGACLLFPVIISGSTAFILEFFHAKPIAPDDLFLTTLSFMGESIARVAEEQNRLESQISATAGAHLLQDVSERLEHAVDVKEATRMALNAIVDNSPVWVLCHCYIVDEKDPSLLLPTHDWNDCGRTQYKDFTDTTLATNFRIGEGMPGRVLQKRVPEWIQDVQVLDAKTFHRAEAAKRTGIHTAAAFPVVFRNRVVLIVELFSEFILQNLTTNLELVAPVAQMLARVMERDAANMSRIILQTVPWAVVALSSVGSIMHCNKAATQLFDVGETPCDESWGITLASLLGPQAAEMLQSALDNIAQGK
eukprot:CAMPEP_0175877212 /NCGR_PEP_ID=MMETSP0107_2-20121207/40488_1 /TAXON_ID=195067 ORGANISM="Goniomonas pacifica, Strain CCMP1869" /NCGR_SAMPLE_ID=MMETSP0107_2 /ASSEMBLY_ACC=CAM_ASM_000203 /LENGTH=459 /DNA_ID=CAMNT_0017196523 /DNA_START=1 /DNA_END=1378 /DNA_ORIENTATION=+